MPKEIKDIRDFLVKTRRPDVKCKWTEPHFQGKKGPRYCHFWQGVTPVRCGFLRVFILWWWSLSHTVLLLTTPLLVELFILFSLLLVLLLLWLLLTVTSFSLCSLFLNVFSHTHPQEGRNHAGLSNCRRSICQSIFSSNHKVQGSMFVVFVHLDCEG